MRVGIGYDVHRLKKGRKLILGGVDISYHLGLDGHSDADVLIHAIMDAMLGAAGLPDIGVNFPDNDSAYKDISSLKLLKKVNQLVTGKGFTLVNVDSTVIAQEPKLSPYMEQMRNNLAETLNIDLGAVGIKATTTEGLGFCGQGLGIAAQSVVLLE
ncbi:MAG: 2-C-methyl-D-erythritol 2,4-cyclodiphosphate synthase [Actinomycetota bacterium]|nr:2-C-methyl-D-erythritol 2,4-cyclodiphosphate synthase [Actinomycetota bacterium]